MYTDLFLWVDIVVKRTESNYQQILTMAHRRKSYQETSVMNTYADHIAGTKDVVIEDKQVDLLIAVIKRFLWELINIDLIVFKSPLNLYINLYNRKKFVFSREPFRIMYVLLVEMFCHGL